MGEVIGALGIGGVFILFLAMIPIWIGYEKKFPRNTDDFHQPDINRAVKREERKSKQARIGEEMAKRRGG
jgi:hypothetical protein